MSLLRKNKQRRERRELRVKSHIASRNQLPRIAVFRSLNNIYGQLIDDNKGITLASCSSLEIKKVKGSKKDVAKAIGVELAKRSIEKGISQVCFDRSRFLYHGRVKAFADGIREGGLKF